ncbi:hypothetical protein Lalb_Chr22g0360211 [Lupinus albus]|uniref:Uncharacterized protein n=1 Tax=Lupinus albus TaxID=3870 RepID=A0A6A4NMT1_LUPAL|nr:hypothetical protein Lalb_Chr22g0360211 [Lupinus albus]
MKSGLFLALDFVVIDDSYNGAIGEECRSVPNIGVCNSDTIRQLRMKSIKAMNMLSHKIEIQVCNVRDEGNYYSL